MSTTIIFVRHGESEGNRTDKFCGILDMPLSEMGKMQAEKTAKFLDKYNIDAIYSSELNRACDTAKIIAKRQNLPVFAMELLREINGGEFEGLGYEEIKNRYPQEYNMWMNDMGNCICPKGESVRDVATRAKDALEIILQKHSDQTVLVVSHGLMLRVMSTMWYQKDITQIREFEWVNNASVTIVEYKDIENPNVILYNEHSHLDNLISALPGNI